MSARVMLAVGLVLLAETLPALTLHPEPGAANPTLTPAAEFGVQTRAAVSPEDQQAEAIAIGKRAGQLAERLSKMLDEARKDKDILRASCVNRKLTEVNTNARSIDQRTRALSDAATAGDDGRRNHEYTVLTVLSAKLDSLDQEAAQCIGQGVYEPGASQINTTLSMGVSPTVQPTLDSYPELPSFDAPPQPPLPTPTPSARDLQLNELQSVGLLGSKGPFTDKQIQDAQGTYQRLSQERLKQLRQDVDDSDKQVRLRTDPQGAADAGKQKSDTFLGRNWIDHNGYVVQLNSKVLRPDTQTVTKVDYTYRAEGPLAGTSVLSNRVSFNLALPEDWTTVYSRDLNDPANLGSGSPQYWRTLQQVSTFSPGSEGCLLCFTTQYVAPGPVAGGGWGQPRTYTISAVPPTGGSPTTLLSQSFVADGSLVAGSDTLSLIYKGGAWQYLVNGSGSSALSLNVIGLSDLGRTKLDLDGGSQTWSALRTQVGGRAADSYVELILRPLGSVNTVDVLLSPSAFLEAF